ncbi:response regulator transcription factor [uncultured Arcticibacterium sp.]|uniref:response regulator transcription factor n=1 Tax=uncultured Arcticibacterium sp. TaxID=2173042 RepID=UPI0030F8BC4C
MKIVLVDDHNIILDSLGMLLKSLSIVSEIKTFNEPQKALQYIQVEELDLLITDYNMPEMNGCSLAVNVRKMKPNLPILMLTISDDFQTIKDAFNAGIKGFVMKKANRSELQSAIEAVGAGKRYYSEGVMKELLNPDNGMADVLMMEEEMPSLTAREIEIIELIGKEMSSIEIAEKLFLSPATVEKHRHNIIKKLGVKNVIGIVKYAYQHNLITP